MVYNLIMEKVFTAHLSSRDTDVFIDSSLSTLVEELSGRGKKVLYIVDRNTRGFLPSGLDVLEVTPGEEAKKIETVMDIIGRAKKSGFARDDMFVAVGGGVICDITALAANLYMRGIGLVLAPTTLLSQVDASLGGKTGVDFEDVKNLIGTFYPASIVFLPTEPLRSLSDSEFRNGLGEVLKHALLASTDELTRFLLRNTEKILARDEKVLGEMIRMSLEVKKCYIEADPTESQGIREALNLGHTFAHGLETMGGLSRFSHGEAVAWGVVKSLRLASAKEFCSARFADEGESLFVRFGFESDYPIDDIDSYIAAMNSDKKKRNGKVRFVVMKEQGVPVLLPLDPVEIIPYL